MKIGIELIKYINSHQRENVLFSDMVQELKIPYSNLERRINYLKDFIPIREYMEKGEGKGRPHKVLKFFWKIYSFDLDDSIYDKSLIKAYPIADELLPHIDFSDSTVYRKGERGSTKYYKWEEDLQEYIKENYTYTLKNYNRINTINSVKFSKVKACIHDLAQIAPVSGKHSDFIKIQENRHNTRPWKHLIIPKWKKPFFGRYDK